jgi:hypothetical protein
LGQQAKAQQAFLANSQLLGGRYLCLDEDSILGILHHTDFLVSQSHANESVEEGSCFHTH